MVISLDIADIYQIAPCIVADKAPISKQFINDVHLKYHYDTLQKQGKMFRLIADRKKYYNVNTKLSKMQLQGC